jgi:hypothetical protein
MPDAVHRDDPRAVAPIHPAAPPRLEAGRVGVVFSRSGDRWAHHVLVDGATRFVSTEGPTRAGDDRWPASPVVTEVALVEAAGGPALVGVGRAGRSHFSLSLIRHPTLPDTVLVEAACRIHEPPGWLGSTYRPLEPPLADEPAPVDADRDSEMIRLPAAPGTSDPGSVPRTVLWTYLIGPTGIVPGRSAPG